MKIKGTVLVGDIKELSTKYAFIKLNSTSEILSLNKEKFNCLVINYMRPEYAVLLPQVDLIIAANGSRFSHLAIVAMSYGKSVILAKDLDLIGDRKEGTVELKVDDSNCLLEFN